MVDLFWDRFCHFLEPAGVVEDDKDVVVHFVLVKERKVRGCPLTHLLFVSVRSGCHKVASNFFTVFDPGCRRLDIAIIVTFLVVEEQNVEFVGSLQADHRFCVDALDRNLILRLGNVSFKVVILEPIASQSELGEGVCGDLIK